MGEPSRAQRPRRTLAARPAKHLAADLARHDEDLPRNSAAGLHERARATLSVCRALGFGFVQHGSASARAVDAALLCANLACAAFGYDHTTSAVQVRMPILWDITMVMIVVKVYTYVLTPPVMLVVWHLNTRPLRELLCRLDDIMAPRPSLRPFARYAAAWFAGSVFMESLAYSLFHFDTDFKYFEAAEYPLIVVYKAWTAVPVYAYIFLVDTVRLGVRDINGRLTSVAAWTAHRGRWKELVRTATRLAEHDFGVIMVTFVVCSIAEVVFFFFSLYFVGHKLNNNVIEMVIFTVNALFSASWMSQVFRVSQNCKSEMLKTQQILGSVKVNTANEFKELKYASLYMLHTDFNFIPCGIFKMSYKSLVTIATLISAFLIFQIQMKLQ